MISRIAVLLVAATCAAHEDIAVFSKIARAANVEAD
jgi:hypothetical protein